MASLIQIGAEPSAHRSPYKRIDPSHPGRKTVITRLEVQQTGGREPDLAIYHFNYILDCWTLKEGV